MIVSEAKPGATMLEWLAEFLAVYSIPTQILTNIS
jgi:hypothetical protein